MEKYSEEIIEKLFETNPDMWIRGVMNENEFDIFSFCSSDSLDATGLESILDYEYSFDEQDQSFEEFVNDWLEKKGLAYNYNHQTQIFSALGVNASGLSEVLAQTGCPGANYLICFEGRYLSDNIANDGAVIKPSKIITILKY